MDLNRISRRAVAAYINARKQGRTQVTIRTRVEDVNALALAIHARAPKLVVYYECLSDRLVLTTCTPRADRT